MKSLFKRIFNAGSVGSEKRESRRAFTTLQQARSNAETIRRDLVALTTGKSNGMSAAAMEQLSSDYKRRISQMGEYARSELDNSKGLLSSAHLLSSEIAHHIHADILHAADDHEKKLKRDIEDLKTKLIASEDLAKQESDNLVALDAAFRQFSDIAKSRHLSKSQQSSLQERLVHLATQNAALSSSLEKGLRSYNPSIVIKNESKKRKLDQNVNSQRTTATQSMMLAKQVKVHSEKMKQLVKDHKIGGDGKIAWAREIALQKAALVKMVKQIAILKVSLTKLESTAFAVTFDGNRESVKQIFEHVERQMLAHTASLDYLMSLVSTLEAENMDAPLAGKIARLKTSIMPALQRLNKRERRIS